LNKLRLNSSVIIKPTDINFGLEVMDTDAYVNQVLQEHLNKNLLTTFPIGG